MLAFIEDWCSWNKETSWAAVFAWWAVELSRVKDTSDANKERRLRFRKKPRRMCVERWKQKSKRGHFQGICEVVFNPAVQSRLPLSQRRVPSHSTCCLSAFKSLAVRLSKSVAEMRKMFVSGTTSLTVTSYSKYIYLQMHWLDYSCFLWVSM